MTTLRGRLQSLFGGGDKGQEDSWRAVPRISVIPPPRGRSITPVVLLLIVAILAELLVLQFYYRDYTDSNTTARALQADIETLGSRLSLKEEDMADSETKIAEISGQIESVKKQASAQEAARGDLSRAYEEITLRPDWAGAFEAILRADGRGIVIQSIRTDVGGKIEAMGTATGITAISGLQDHFRSESDVLDLMSLQIENAEGAQSFRAEIQIR